VRILTVQHFARFAVVGVIVPMAFLWVGGAAVGSAAGAQLDTTPAGWWDYGWIAVIAACGMWGGLRLRLPAAQFMGPLVLCALCQGVGVTDLHPPAILMNTAQLVVGAGLGAQFAGLTLVMLARCFGLGLVCVAGMLAIGALFALGLTQLVSQPFQPLFISFAPGGMTEMGLIALSLDASPILVTAHHLFRIIVTVLGMALWARLRGLT